MCVKMEAQGPTMKPQGHPKCQRDTTRSCKVPQRPKRHIQTARGRVLAEGDVDPARVEGTTHQAACRSPHRGSEVQVHKGFVLEVDADLFPRPKPSESFFVLAHVDGQRVKTRGPNPNPTTQAQSKRCLPLFTKTHQNTARRAPQSDAFLIPF